MDSGERRQLWENQIPGLLISRSFSGSGAPSRPSPFSAKFRPLTRNSGTDFSGGVEGEYMGYLDTEVQKRDFNYKKRAISNLDSWPTAN